MNTTATVAQQNVTEFLNSSKHKNNQSLIAQIEKIITIESKKGKIETDFTSAVLLPQAVMDEVRDAGFGICRLENESDGFDSVFPAIYFSYYITWENEDDYCGDCDECRAAREESESAKTTPSEVS